MALNLQLKLSLPEEAKFNPEKLAATVEEEIKWIAEEEADANPTADHDDNTFECFLATKS